MISRVSSPAGSIRSNFEANPFKKKTFDGFEGFFSKTNSRKELISLLAAMNLRCILLVHVCRLSALVIRFFSLNGGEPATAGAAAIHGRVRERKELKD